MRPTSRLSGTDVWFTGTCMEAAVKDGRTGPKHTGGRESSPRGSACGRSGWGPHRSPAPSGQCGAAGATEGRAGRIKGPALSPGGQLAGKGRYGPASKPWGIHKGRIRPPHGEQGKRQPGGLSGAAGSDPNESCETSRATAPREPRRRLSMRIPASFAQAPAAAAWRTKAPCEGEGQGRAPRTAPARTPDERASGKERMPIKPLRRKSRCEARSGGKKGQVEEKRRREGRPRKRPKKGRISRATEVSRTRPQDRMRRARKWGNGAPRRAMRRTGKAERGSEEVRPAPPCRAAGPDERACATTGTACPPPELQRPAQGIGRSDRVGGGATAGGPKHSSRDNDAQAGRPQTSPRDEGARAAREDGRGPPRAREGPTKPQYRRGRAAPDQAPSPAGSCIRHTAPGGPSPGRSERAGVILLLYFSSTSSRSKITRITCSGFPSTLSAMISAAFILSLAGVL